MFPAIFPAKAAKADKVDLFDCELAIILFIELVRHKYSYYIPYNNDMPKNARFLAWLLKTIHIFG